MSHRSIFVVLTIVAILISANCSKADVLHQSDTVVGNILFDARTIVAGVLSLLSVLIYWVDSEWYLWS